MSALETVELLGFGITLAFAAVALWQRRGDDTEIGRMARRRVYGIVLGMSLLPLHVFFRDELSRNWFTVGLGGLLILLVAGGAAALIHRS